MVDEDCQELVHTLTRLKYVVRDQPNPWHNEIFARNFSYFAGIGLDPETAQRLLLKSHVVILGIGGTGSIVLQHLVGAGIGRYTLIDFDIVNVTNLNRQFIYNRDDVGRQKVLVAAEYVRDRLPDAEIETRSTAVRSCKDLEQLALSLPIAFFVNAADNPACDVVDAVSEFCALRHIPFLGGGCGFMEGRYGPLVSASAGTEYMERRKLAVAKAELLGVVNESTQPVSFGPLNTVVGAFMARDVIEHLAGGATFSCGQHVSIDLRRMTIVRDAALFPGKVGNE